MVRAARIVADRLRRQPFEVVVFVVQDGFPGGPAGSERYDDIVAAASPWVDYRDAQVIATVLGPVLMALAVPAAWQAARRREPAAAYMLVGWTTYAVGALVMAGLLRGALPLNLVTQHIFQAGWLLEGLAWLRVLGLHTAALRRGAERSAVEKRTLEALAATDALTGLPNRRGLQAALAQALPQARAGSALALYLIDLDGFKPVNDRLGHEAGDEVLVGVARRLQALLRGSDVVARTVAEAVADRASESAQYGRGRCFIIPSAERLFGGGANAGDVEVSGDGGAASGVGLGSGGGAA